MQTLSAFIDLLLGFVPFVATVLILVSALWAATKLFPEFGAKFNCACDALFGVDAEYDKKHNTGYAPHPRRW